MPQPEDWTKFPNNIEFFIPLLHEDHDLRIRVRRVMKQKGRSNKKDIDLFFVGYEIKHKGNWKLIVGHCNYHYQGQDKSIFHTHNDYLLPHLGAKERVLQKIPKKKASPSQFRWSIKNIKHFHRLYLKQFLVIVKNDPALLLGN